MDIKNLKNSYKSRGSEIRRRLQEFKNLSEDVYQKELMFCILTPQSNAQRCWEAVEQISNLEGFNKEKIREILKSKTRFHNNKTKYIMEAREAWNNTKSSIKNEDTKGVRNWLADNVNGYGLKEASHFLRNIGKSENKLAILDRHILKNLKELKVIKDAIIKGRKDYLEKEQKFLNFAEKIGIPADELDLLFWSQENGQIFK